MGIFIKRICHLDSQRQPGGKQEAARRPQEAPPNPEAAQRQPQGPEDSQRKQEAARRQPQG